ncbi:DUF1206 domain-containing protein [Amnibacterium endophyticum]|uniref:DUF1206 domain-containing protein n=1 Tax=Amnibacterium endophyticum TaxID=2109337 RepID=A0ABW4LJP3_9MICO
MTETARQNAEGVQQSTWFRGLARFGFAASGLVQGLVGVLAIQVAVQGGGQEADQSGALKALAQAPFGAVVVWLVAIGGLALALWLVVDGFLERGSDAKRVWKERVKAWGKAVVYGAVGVTALRTVLGASQDSSRSARQGSSTVLSLPGGQILLGLVGVGVVVIGVALVHRGVTKGFLETIRVPSGSRGRAVVVLGQVGYVARGVAIAVVGILFVVAAWRTDPGAASGLDGALRAFAGLPFGRVVLAAIGVGWIASGVYLVARARLARLD